MNAVLGHDAECEIASGAVGFDGVACLCASRAKASAATPLCRPRCAWCGRRTSGLRFKTCREHYDLEQALRLYYNGGRTHGG